MALVVIIFVLNIIFGWSEAFLKPESLPALRYAVAENQFEAMLVYIAVTVVGSVVLALPGIVFAIAAGALFGPWWGTVACSVASTLGACFAFLISRYFLKDTIKPIVTRSKHIQRIFYEESGKNYLFLLMLTRMAPIPFNLQNFAYGVTDIAFWPYAGYSFLFMLPATAAYVFAAAGIIHGQNRLILLMSAAALLALVACASFFLRKLFISNVKQEQSIEIQKQDPDA